MKFYLAIFLSLGLFSAAKAQTKPAPQSAPSDSLKVVQILSADRYGFKRLDSLTDILILVGKVALKQENTIFYADSAVYNRNGKIVEAFKNVHINDNDSIDTYSDYLLYYTDTKQATLRDHVRLTDGKSTLYTDNLQYDVNQKTGIYHSGGKVVNGTSILTSKEGTYYADLKDVYFKDKVVLTDPKYKLKSDSLLYNTNSQIATFITKTFIEDSAKRTITTSEGFYDLQNKNASFGRRPIIKDKAATVIADHVDTDERTGMNVLTGNAVYKDTAEGLVMLANLIVSNRNNGSLRATQKPLMIIKQDKDSTFIAADTLYTGRLVDLMIELEERRIRDSIQAHADSVRIAEEEKALIESAVVKKDSLSKKDSLASNKTPTPPPFNFVPSVDIARTVGLRSRFETEDSLKKVQDSLKSAIALAPDSVSQSSDTSLAAKKFAANARDSLTGMLKDTAAKISINNGQVDSVSIARSDSASIKDSTGQMIVDLNSKDTATTDTTTRFFRAFHHVRIFSDSLQAVSDSLFYSAKDSIFRLFKDPIVWASNSQVTGDTIYMSTKNKKPDQLYVFENGMMINKTGERNFNQLRGNRIYGYFLAGDIDHVQSKGNAESVYYVKDEGEKLVGVNKAASDIIEMRFKAKELNKVVFISAAKGTMFPARQITEADSHLRGFNWQDEKRPKTKFELFGN